MQGYLLNSIEKTIRVRTKGNQGFITIKGKTEHISRVEYEYEIPVHEAEELLNTFCPKKIDKIRYELVFEGFLWEVDVDRKSTRLNSSHVRISYAVFCL